MYIKETNGSDLEKVFFAPVFERCSESHSFWPQSNNKVVGLIVRSGPCVLSCCRGLWLLSRVEAEPENHSKRRAGVLGEGKGNWHGCPLFWHFVFEENFLEIEFCFFLSLGSESYFSWSIHHPPSTGGLSGGIRVCGIVLCITRPRGEPNWWPWLLPMHGCIW